MIGFGGESEKDFRGLTGTAEEIPIGLQKL
jgi:hypothetical protein